MKMRVLNSDEKNGQGKLEQQRYRGVRKRKWGKYVSEIRLPNSRERIWLGSYETAEKAARAFDAAIYCLRGRNANFNFPHDPPDIAGGRSLDAAQIQLVAAQFANEAPPPLPEAVLPVKDSSASDCMSPLSSVSEAAVESCSFFDSLPPLMAEIALDESQFGVFSSQFDDFGSDILFPPIPEAEYIDGAETGYYQLSSLWNF